jgi:hypothetical protein
LGEAAAAAADVENVRAGKERGNGADDDALAGEFGEFAKVAPSAAGVFLTGRSGVDPKLD